MKFWDMPGSLRTQPDATFPDNHDETQKRRHVDPRLPDRHEDPAALMIGRARGDPPCRAPTSISSPSRRPPVEGVCSATIYDAGRRMKRGCLWATAGSMDAAAGAATMSVLVVWDDAEPTGWVFALSD